MFSSYGEFKGESLSFENVDAMGEGVSRLDNIRILAHIHAMGGVGLHFLLRGGGKGLYACGIVGEIHLAQTAERKGVGCALAVSGGESRVVECNGQSIHCHREHFSIGGLKGQIGIGVGLAIDR